MNEELRHRIIDLDLSEQTKLKLIDLVDKYLNELYDLQQENKQLKDNWNELKEWVETTNTWYDDELGIVDMKGYNTNRTPIIWKNSLLFEIQELEKGENNE